MKREQRPATRPFTVAPQPAVRLASGAGRHLARLLGAELLARQRSALATTDSKETA